MLKTYFWSNSGHPIGDQGLELGGLVVQKGKCSAHCPISLAHESRRQSALIQNPGLLCCGGSKAAGAVKNEKAGKPSEEAKATVCSLGRMQGQEGKELASHREQTSVLDVPN